LFHGIAKMISRPQAVELALTWKGTPYVTGGRVRGAGCDCATLISEYLIGIGAAAEVPLFTYAQDWFCHTADERYFDELSKYAKCIWEGRCVGTPPAQPGDLAIFRVAGSKVYNHGCIVTGWPRALHCFNRDSGVIESRPALHSLISHHDMAIFDPWALHADRPRADALRGGEAVAAELFRFAVGLERTERGS
jgi:cell wall-associated NlpC family hydrolase